MKRNIDLRNQGTMNIRVPNACLYFDGIDDYVNCSGLTALGDEFSISFWADLDSYNSASGNVGIICIDYDDWSPSGGISIVRTSGSSVDSIEAILKSTSNTKTVTFQTDTSPLNEDTWNNYILVFDKPNVYTYLNGYQTDTDTWSYSVGWNDYSTQLGKWRGNGECFHGKLDNIQIWNCALTSDEVYKVYNGLNIQDTSRVAYWKCLDRDGDDLTDYMENNDGIISGAIWVDRNIRSRR